MKETGDVAPPWGYKLAWSGLLAGVPGAGMEVDKKIDLDYHVRHSALPRPGGERELGILVSRLHSIPWISPARCGNATLLRVLRTTGLRSTPRCINP